MFPKVLSNVCPWQAHLNYVITEKCWIKALPGEFHHLKPMASVWRFATMAETLEFVTDVSQFPVQLMPYERINAVPF